MICFCFFNFQAWRDSDKHKHGGIFMFIAIRSLSQHELQYIFLSDYLLLFVFMSFDKVAQFSDR